MRRDKRYTKHRFYKHNRKEPAGTITSRRDRKPRASTRRFNGISKRVSRPDRAFRSMATTRHPPLNAGYDRSVDVLHIALGTPVPAEGEGHQGGLELRYALENDAPCGATVIGFRRNSWQKKIDRLCGLIADHLRVPPEDVAIAIRKAINA
jgi:hypothetical protein